MFIVKERSVAAVLVALAFAGLMATLGSCSGLTG